MPNTHGKPPLTLKRRLQNARLRLQREGRIFSLTRQVKRQASPNPGQRPGVMFNASARLGGFSQNSAFALLTVWGLQLAGVPVIHFACRAGMSRCVLGTNPDDHTEAPPCAACIAQSKRLLRSAEIHWFDYREKPELDAALEDLDIQQLSSFKYPLEIPNPLTPNHLTPNSQPAPPFPRSLAPLPLGPLTLPSLRWALRRHHLINDESTRFLLREYIQSAYRVAMEFDALLAEVNPAVVVVFNGIMFPEAAARWVACQRGVRVVTHEVGFQAFSAFFTDEQATAYPIRIPVDFELTPEQNARLDAHLSQRFKGEFTMAGIRFWPQISGLSDDFNRRAAQFEQIVPVFTNVVFDTSQVHANTIFPHMFAWLDLILDIVRQHPETFFVIRAHPDEKRAGKVSRESVSNWINRHGVTELPNVLFVDSLEPLSSYELLRRSKFIMVYNSSIGLEGTLLGVPVVCGGQARYTQYPTVFLPPTSAEYRKRVEEFLRADQIEVPPEFKINARRFLYYQFYRASLLLDKFIEAHPTPGYVQLKRFSWRDLTADNSPTMRVLANGIVDGAPFLMPDE